MMIGFFYCPSEDCTCPYYSHKTGECKLGKNALHECDDAYALVGADYEEELEEEEIFACYDPD
jgi:hypothetical protein